MSLSLQNTGRFCSYYKQECFHPYIVKEVKTFDLSIYFSCPVGHYCPAGSVEPIRCENGTYQDQTTQWTCKTCPAGYFCDNTVDIVILDNSTTVCPMGMYCPEGTRYSNEFKCPIGTFNNRTGKYVLVEYVAYVLRNYVGKVNPDQFTSIIVRLGMEEENDCTPCSGGYYCDLHGMVTPVDLCNPGYYCKQNAMTGTPDQGIESFQSGRARY